MNQLDKMLIIPIQYTMLQKQYEETLAMNQLQVAIMKERRKDVNDSQDDYHEPIADDCAKRERAMTLATLQACENILKKAVIVDTYSKDIIDIGTRCQILITTPSERYIEDLILIHKRVANESPEIFVSCDTALGISIKGHKVGDVISYKDGRGNMCSVEILKIYDHCLEETELEEQPKLR